MKILKNEQFKVGDKVINIDYKCEFYTRIGVIVLVRDYSAYAAYMVRYKDNAPRWEIEDSLMLESELNQKEPKEIALSEIEEELDYKIKIKEEIK